MKENVLFLSWELLSRRSLSPGIRITQYRGREAGLQLFHLFLQKQEFTDPLVGICFYRHFNFMENWFFLLNTRVFLQLRYAHYGIAGDWVNTDVSILDTIIFVSGVRLVRY
jgi:hypothetical protein